MPLYCSNFTIFAKFYISIKTQARSVNMSMTKNYQSPEMEIISNELHGVLCGSPEIAEGTMDGVFREEFEW